MNVKCRKEKDLCYCTNEVIFNPNKIVLSEWNVIQFDGWIFLQKTKGKKRVRSVWDKVKILTLTLTPAWGYFTPERDLSQFTKCEMGNTFKDLWNKWKAAPALRDRECTLKVREWLLSSVTERNGIWVCGHWSGNWFKALDLLVDQPQVWELICNMIA